MPILEVQHIEKSFGNTKVLKDISFSMEKGTVLSIIGSSGGGKTTLLRCLNFLETPERGSISVNGEVLFNGERNEKHSDGMIRLNRLHFGLVFQSFHLFPQYTALENVSLAGKLLAKDREDFRVNKAEIFKEIDEKSAELLTTMGLKERMNHYPHQLSGGQQQRVAIARALALKPDILCFDEPTSALDPELTVEVLKVIKELAAEHMTMIIVTHEMQFAKEVSDQIIFMGDGVIKAQGTPGEVFDSKDERVREFLGKLNS